MEKRDLEFLLAVKSGDSVKYQLYWDKLNEYASSVASAWFSSSVLRDNVVEQAMNEVADWLKNDGILKVDWPWAYAKKIIFYSLGRSSKNRQLEEVDVTAVRDTADKQALCFIDDSLRKRFVKDEGDIEDDDWGLRVFQIKDTDKPKKKFKDNYLAEYKPNKGIELLGNLLRYRNWWDGESFLLKFPSRGKIEMQDWDEVIEEAHSRFVEYCHSLWAKYNLVTGLIDNTRNPSERRVMKAYLSGDKKQVETARGFNVSKAYISRVVNDHFREWGWDNRARDEAREILLTHCIAAFFNEFIKEVKKSYNTPHLYPNRHFYPPEYISQTYFGRFYSDGVFPVEAWHKEKFYSRVVNSGETKAYLSDLEKTENNIHNLLNLGEEFWRLWYPSQQVGCYFTHQRDSTIKTRFYDMSIEALKPG